MYLSEISLNRDDTTEDRSDDTHCKLSVSLCAAAADRYPGIGDLCY